MTTIMYEGFDGWWRDYISGRRAQLWGGYWAEELKTPILNHYFKRVRIDYFTYGEIKRRRRGLGLN